MAAWRRLNFGFRLLAADRLSVTAIRAEIERYDAHDSAVVTDWIREHASDTEAWTACQAVHRRTGAEGPRAMDGRGGQSRHV